MTRLLDESIEAVQKVPAFTLRLLDAKGAHFFPIGGC